jgi:peptide deformylase
MSIQTIIQLGDERLRQPSAVVPMEEIPSQSIQTLIADLTDTLHSNIDGVGISAPQIGVNKRIFIIGPLAFGDDPQGETLVCINPVITKFSRRKSWGEEGCLSIRWKYGQVERSRQVTLEYYDEHGNFQSRGFGGFVARVVQHELDHLDGILFIDKAEKIYELSDEEIAQYQQQHLATPQHEL